MPEAIDTTGARTPIPGTAQDAPEGPMHGHGDSAGTSTLPEGPGGPQDAADDDSRDPRVASLSREAAQRRRQLRDAEQELGALRQQVDAMHRSEVARLVAERLHDPSDLLRDADLAALRGEDGNVDPGRVQAAVDALVKNKPHYAKPPQLVPFDGGASQVPIPAPGPSLGAAIKRASRG